MKEIFDINADELDQYLDEGKAVVLLIWKKHCSLCARFKPFFKELPEEYPDIQFLMMNMMETMENLRLAERYEADTTPIIPVFCEGEHLGTFVGLYEEDEFKSRLEEILEKNC